MPCRSTGRAGFSGLSKPDYPRDALGRRGAGKHGGISHRGSLPFQYTGTRVVIFTDCVRDILRQGDFVGVAVLGHVLAHEIGHVLLGNDEHADEGIMKAYWSASDKTGMRHRPLRFTNNEADMMRRRFDGQGAVIAAR